MVSYDYESGLRGLKQINRSMEVEIQAARTEEQKIAAQAKADETLEKHTARFLDRQGYFKWRTGELRSNKDEPDRRQTDSE